MSLVTLANLTIPKFNGQRKIIYPNGNTDDIIKVVDRAHPFAVKEMQGFVRGITGNQLQKCKQIYEFLKDNVKLEHDPLGIQDVQKPSSLWHRKKGDCKSYSLFIAACLQNLGIPYEYTYISQHPLNNKVTHVYIVAYPDSVRTVMDVNIKSFNKEVKRKYFTIKKNDKEMAEIAMVGAVGVSKFKKVSNGFSRESILQKRMKARKSKSRIGSYIDDYITGIISKEEHDLWAMKDRLNAEKRAVGTIAGIGSLKYQHYQDINDSINDMIYGIGRINPERYDEYAAMVADDMDNGNYRIADKIAGIGAVFNDPVYAQKAMTKERKRLAKKRFENRVNRLQAGSYPITESSTEIGNIFKKIGKGVKKAAKKVGTGVKKAAKGVAKVAKKVAKTVYKGMTAPIRLFVTPRLKKSGPAFLYTFLTDAQAAKLPPKVQTKRKKQLATKKRLIGGLSYDDKRLTAIFRTSIIDHYKKSPEAVLKEMFKGTISGIGWVMVAVEAVMAILSKLFGGKGEKFDKNDAPDDSDFSGLNQEVVTELNTGFGGQGTSLNYDGGYSDGYNGSSGSSSGGDSGYSANLYNTDGSLNESGDYAESEVFENGGQKSTGICNF